MESQQPPDTESSTLPEPDDVQLLPKVNNWIWTDDIASDLEIFVQFVKVGHFDRAFRFFDEYLSSYLHKFPVFVEYVDALLERGTFGLADRFLDDFWRGDCEAMHFGKGEEAQQKWTLTMMHALARLHTHLESFNAMGIIEKTTAALKELDAETLISTKMQELVMAVRMMDALERIDGFRQNPLPPFPGSWILRWVRELERPRRDHSLVNRSLSVVELLMQKGRLWEARVLISYKLKRALEHKPPRAHSIGKWVGYLRQLLEEEVDEDEATVRLLVVMSTLADLDGNDLPSSLRALQSDVLSEATFGLKTLDQIDTPLVETRAYQVLSSLNHMARDDLVTRDTTSHARVHEDHQLNIRLCCMRIAKSGRNPTTQRLEEWEARMKTMSWAQDRDTKQEIPIWDPTPEQHSQIEKELLEIERSSEQTEDTLGIIEVLCETQRTLDPRPSRRKTYLVSPAVIEYRFRKIAEDLGPGMQMKFMRSIRDLQADIALYPRFAKVPAAEESKERRSTDYFDDVVPEHVWYKPPSDKSITAWSPKRKPLDLSSGYRDVSLPFDAAGYNPPPDEWSC